MRSKLLTAVAASGLISLATAPSAGAAVTIGQLAPGSSPPELCNVGPTDLTQASVGSGNSYVMPGEGTITSWTHNAAGPAGQTLKMKVFRPIAGSTYSVVGHDGPRNLVPDQLNTFPASIPVKAGDLLGVNNANAGTVPNACTFAAVGTDFLMSGDTPDGGQVTFGQANMRRVNVTAVFVPTNTVAIGATKRKKKNGTAKLTLNVPNAGELTASGKGVKVSGAAAISKAVTPGEATLLIKAKGKKKRKLNDTGKVKVSLTITYTPTGGDTSSQSTKVKLKKTL
jgi:hypothetical protein